MQLGRDCGLWGMSQCSVCCCRDKFDEDLSCECQGARV